MYTEVKSEEDKTLKLMNVLRVKDVTQLKHLADEDKKLKFIFCDQKEDNEQQDKERAKITAAKTKEGPKTKENNINELKSVLR